MIHYGDITKLSGYELPIVDVIVGGSPCQDLSVAGKRAGLNGERSGLFMEQIRIVKEMRERDKREHRRTGWMVRPRYLVWENVPGAFSSNGGKDFQAALTEIVRIAEPQAPDVSMPDKGWPLAGCLSSEWGGGASLGDYTMPSFGEYPSEENVSRLSQILEDSPHPKYSLSAKACQGILNRAKRRGKKLPDMLETALIAQASSME